MAPTVLFVPGLWEGSAVFGPVSMLLNTAGYSTETASIASTGHISPNAPTMDDDIAAVHAHLSKLIETEEKEVVLVCHSAGGFIGSSAMENLAFRIRSAKEKKGGVVKLVLLTAAIFPEGFKHGPLPFYDIQVRVPPPLFN